MQGVLGGTHPAPVGEAGRRLALPGGSSGSKGVESSWMAAEQEECGHGDRRPTSSRGHAPTHPWDRGGAARAACVGAGASGAGIRAVSPAAGIVGALSAAADAAKRPLGAADGCSARIPAG